MKIRYVPNVVATVAIGNPANDKAFIFINAAYPIANEPAPITATKNVLIPLLKACLFSYQNERVVIL